MKIDLHCHSNFSDGLARLDEIEDKCLRNGHSVILTDHNEVRGSIRLYERGIIKTIPALEVSSKEGIEFLIYFKDSQSCLDFYKKAVEPYRYKRFMVRLKNPAVNVLETAKQYECKISIAHPYGFGKKAISFWKHPKETINRIEKMINAVEIYNGNTPSKANEKAFKFANSLSLPITVGSDGHNIESIGCVTKEINSDDIFGSLLDESLINTEHNISMTKTGLIIAAEHTKYFIFTAEDKTELIHQEIDRLW